MELQKGKNGKGKGKGLGPPLKKSKYMTLLDEPHLEYMMAIESKAKQMDQLASAGAAKSGGAPNAADLIVTHPGELHGAICEITDLGDSKLGLFAVRVLDRDVIPSYEAMDIAPDLYSEF